jgi:biopolymer transport protein ExbD
MKFSRKAKVGNVIPTASMADISFLLLVFFMVSTVFVRYRGFPVQLPEAEKIEKLENRHIVITIWVDPAGRISIGTDAPDGSKDSKGLAVTLDQVAKVMHQRLTIEPRTIVSLKADANAEFGLVSDVLQELRKVEALRVNFATERERKE